MLDALGLSLYVGGAGLGETGKAAAPDAGLDEARGHG